jgi:hypothetical protein
MSYRLSKLAPGSYDIILDGLIIAGLVRSTTGRHYVKWTAELLVDLPLGEMPSPFAETEHEFPTLEAACTWLGVPVSEMHEAVNDR